MNAVLSAVMPGAVNLLRIDHAHVMASFHHYDLGASARTRHALAHTLFLALEVHATLEEEIFYPAVHAVDPSLIENNVAEQREWRLLIARLRAMDVAAPEFDGLFLELMRGVFHHVADEETQLLPQAEALLGKARLAELGAEMTRRRLQLTTPHAGEIALETLRGAPTSTLVMAAGSLLAGSYLFTHALHRTRRG